MKRVITSALLACLLLAGCVSPKGNVVVGALSESGGIEKTALTIADEGLGKHTVLFHKSPWNPDMLEKVAEVCRKNGMTFTMDEVMLAEIEWKLNHRPRKSLGYRTPLEYCKQLFNFDF